MRKTLLTLGILAGMAACQGENATTEEALPSTNTVYTPDYSSLSQHPLPDWFNNAKLGIFIHWGLYSVPGWAKATELTLEETLEKDGAKTWFLENPYAEWYYNSLRIDGSATQTFHAETYGEDYSYFDFAKDFNREIEKFDPNEWAKIFKDAGAGYVVLTSKHHDGFLLWPSANENPFHENYFASRDLVGELTEAVRQEGMEMGLYYSSGLDWTFNPQPIVDFPTLFTAVPQTEEYANYIDRHWRELMERYQPSILWADIGSPEAFNEAELIADFYNTFPEGVVNNRHSSRSMMGGAEKEVWYDFLTPEYTVLDSISEKKWETCRGIGLSFGYNQMEDVNDFLSDKDLIQSFVDIVSKNGNLLLNVGPRADGSIQDGQLSRLKALGAWLRANGEGIYASRPWIRAEGETGNGKKVRFTQKGNTLYAFVMDYAGENTITLSALPEAANAKVSLLDGGNALTSSSAADGSVTIQLPANTAASYALGLAISLN
jgi:alpha-L-fucosidase